jgi:hypothetical protein
MSNENRCLRGRCSDEGDDNDNGNDNANICVKGERLCLVNNGSSEQVVVLKTECEFNVNGHCIVGLKCSLLDLNGNVRVCKYLPNKRGRFTFRRQKC